MVLNMRFLTLFLFLVSTFYFVNEESKNLKKNKIKAFFFKLLDCYIYCKNNKI